MTSILSLFNWRKLWCIQLLISLMDWQRVNLDVVCMALMGNLVLSHYLAQWECIQVEQKWYKNWTLRDLRDMFVIISSSKLCVGMRWSWPGRLAPCATSTALHTFSQPSLWLWPQSCLMPSAVVSTSVAYSPLSPTVWFCAWLSLDNCPAPSRCGTTPCGLFGRLKWVVVDTCSGAYVYGTNYMQKVMFLFILRGKYSVRILMIMINNVWYNISSN